MPYKTHFTILQETASLYPSRAAFKIPVLSADDGKIIAWQPISYAQFKSDVDLYGRYWSHVLSTDGIPQRSVVGLWLGGFSYTDILHIYGVEKACYIPQLFSLRLPNPDVIYELLDKANAQALIYDPSFRAIVTNPPVSSHAATESLDYDAENLSVPPSWDIPLHEEDIMMIFHTSGSTSGSPKLVRCSYRWLIAIIAKAEEVSKPRDIEQQDVTVWMGSMCHIGQTFMLLGALQHGSCTIQPTRISFSSDELVDMITRGGLNRLNQFATFLAAHLRNSRKDAKLLTLLAGLHEVLYSGLPLPSEEEKWAYRSGLPLRNLFGSTECGAMLISIGGQGCDARLLRPIGGTSYEFSSITPASQSKPSHVNANEQMLELVILAESGDCPDPLLRHEDGNYHTGDLFIEVMKGAYAFRGRDDDWIKSENSLRCDTKAIEDNIQATCGDLVADCIVVGNGRPSPTLFVEPIISGDEEKLKKDIVRKTRHFHSRRYLHERITSTKFIIVVDRGALPRTATKGNIRRKAVEDAYKEELDTIYGVTA